MADATHIHGAGDGDVRPTLLRVELDCTVCLARTLDRLAALPEVVRVEAHTAAGCLVVEHRGPLDRVVATIEQVGHRIEVASNGEAVMAPAVVEPVGACGHHPHAPVARTPLVAGATGRPS